MPICCNNYSADIFRFATLVFQETAKVTASKNMFISVAEWFKTVVASGTPMLSGQLFIPNIRCIEIFNQISTYTVVHLRHHLQP
jgi:hypothetical protein